MNTPNISSNKEDKLKAATIAGYYFSGFLCMIFAFFNYLSFNESGYVYGGKGIGKIKVFGDSALANISLFFISGVFLLIIGVYKHIHHGKFFLHYKADKKPIIPSVTLICPKCETPYDSNELSSCDCPICNIKLESLSGFYYRHPEFKK